MIACELQQLDAVFVGDLGAVDPGFEHHGLLLPIFSIPPQHWLHGKSEATKAAYRSDLSKFVDFTESKPLRTVTLADVQEFADFLSELLAPATQARILVAMKSLFSFGHQVGYLPFDVGRPVKLPSHRDDRAERILSADDIHSIFAHAKKHRDRALIRTLCIGGLRVAEAVGLRGRDLVLRGDGSEADGQLAVFGKGSKTSPVIVKTARPQPTLASSISEA